MSENPTVVNITGGGRGADWRDRVAALLQAARDVNPGSRTAGSASVTWSTGHRILFERYVYDLRRAIQGANLWWDAMIETQLPRSGGDRIRAAREVARRNPVGPVADRGVIAVLRQYWLECVALNAQHPDEQLAPEEFVLGSLCGSSFEASARFLSQLPYWPLGLSADGCWI
jgi:hypothetical protein